MPFFNPSIRYLINGNGYITDHYPVLIPHLPISAPAHITNFLSLNMPPPLNNFRFAENKQIYDRKPTRDQGAAWPKDSDPGYNSTRGIAVCGDPNKRRQANQQKEQKYSTGEPKPYFQYSLLALRESALSIGLFLSLTLRHNIEHG